MRVSAVGLQNANVKQNFKSRENKSKNNTVSGNRHKRDISSLDPKVLAMAAALVTMTPSCSSDNQTKQSQPEDPVMSYVSQKYNEHHNDSVIDEKRFYYGQLIDLIDTDNAKLEQTGRNTFKGSVDFKDHKVDLDIQSASNDLRSLSGVVKVTSKQWKSEDVYKFEADVIDKYNVDLKLQNELEDGLEPKEYTLHRNFDGQLFAINKETNSIAVLNKSYFEEIHEKDVEYKQDKEDKKKLLAALAVFFIGMSSAYYLGSASANTNKRK